MSAEPHRDQVDSPSSFENRSELDPELVYGGVAVPEEEGPTLENKTVSETQMEFALQQASQDVFKPSVIPGHLGDQDHSASALHPKRLPVLVTSESAIDHFSSVKVGERAMCSVTFTNWSTSQQKLLVKSCKEPFSVDPMSVMLPSGPGSEKEVTIMFQPDEVKQFVEEIIIGIEETGEEIILKISGDCVM